MAKRLAKYASTILSVLASVFLVVEKYPLGEKQIPVRKKA